MHLRAGRTVICTFDADGQHSPQAVGDLLEGLIVLVPTSLWARDSYKSAPPFPRSEDSC